MKPRKLIGWLLIVSGVLILVFSNKIVFPGLERLIGIDAIVGTQNVFYQPDGGYLYTNPGAVVRWVSSIAAIGISIALTGVLVLIHQKKK
jgi:hypothetical protein